MLGTKELYDLMTIFEKSNTAYSRRYTRESKDQWSKKQYYQHGETNQLFVAFLQGYAYAKSMAMQGAFEQ